MKLTWNDLLLLCILLVLPLVIIFLNQSSFDLFNLLIAVFFIDLFLIALFILKPDKFSLITKAWLAMGNIMGLIIAPVVWALIFYLIFGVLGIVMKFFGRDILALKPMTGSNWNNPADSRTKANFDDQY